MGKLLTICLLLSIIYFICPQNGKAQELDLKQGDRIMVSYDSLMYETFLFVIKIPFKTYTFKKGTFRSQTDEFVYLSTDSSEQNILVLSKDSINNIYTCFGKRKATVEGLLYGFGMSSSLALLFCMAPSSHYDDDSTSTLFYDGNPKWENILRFVAGSTLIGGFIGWCIKVDKWRKIDKKNWALDIDANILKNEFKIELSFKF